MARCRLPVTRSIDNTSFSPVSVHMSRYAARFLAFIVSIGLLAGTAHAQVPNFDALYVFGDSLADNGNDLVISKLLGSDPAVPPSVSPHRTYFQGRFSNGYVGVEYLWQGLSGQAPGSTKGLKPFLSQPLFPLGAAVDFAFGDTGTGLLDEVQGGALLPGLKGQIELYLAASRSSFRRPRRPLFVIITGSNYYSGNTPLSPPQVVGNIVDAVRSLHQNGARDVMVVNLGDLGQIPANASSPNSGLATAVSLAHNQLLRAALDGLQAQIPRLNIIQPDVIDFADHHLPAGLERIVPALEFVFLGDPRVPPNFHMSACIFIDPATCLDVPNPNQVFNRALGFAFWDLVHPTAEAHVAFAQYMLSTLSDYYSHPH
jgi:phospholipase/lecithinase/hemolysin